MLIIGTHWKFHDQQGLFFAHFPNTLMLHHWGYKLIAVNDISLFGGFGNRQIEIFQCTDLTETLNGKNLQGGIIAFMVFVSFGDGMDDEFGTQTFAKLLMEHLRLTQIIDTVTTQNKTIAYGNGGDADAGVNVLAQSAGLGENMTHIFFIHDMIGTEQCKGVAMLQIDMGISQIECIELVAFNHRNAEGREQLYLLILGHGLFKKNAINMFGKGDECLFNSPVGRTYFKLVNKEFDGLACSGTSTFGTADPVTQYGNEQFIVNNFISTRIITFDIGSLGKNIFGSLDF